MWFTFSGRLHTRLASLVGPLILTVVVAAATGDSDYWLLFVLMASVGIVLDAVVYGWLLGYQPRWLTIGLGVVEFLLLKWIVEWPYPFEIRLHTRQALSFYVVAWLLTWLTTQAVLPVLWPRWVEDGGEFRSARKLHAIHQAPRLGDTWARREAFLSSWAALLMVSLPWLAAIAWMPTGQRFVGLLWLEQEHLRALVDVYVGSKDMVLGSSGYLLGSMANLGRWSALATYQVAWVLMAFGWLLGTATLLIHEKRRLLVLIAFGWLPILLLPANWLLYGNVLMWSMILVSRWRPFLTGVMPRVTAFLAAISVLVWIFSWLRMPDAPYVYVGEDVWQMLSWLKHGLPSDVVILAPPQLSELVSSLGGRQAISDVSGVTAYQILTGPDCVGVSTIFFHGNTCVIGP
jgi:hypothetical protein